MNPAAVTIASIHGAFARKLADLNRRHLLAGGTGDIQAQDPRDISAQIQALASHLACHGPHMDTVEALGAQITALALAVARVEDSRFDLGDAA